MGRLLESLLADSQHAPAAIQAIPASPARSDAHGIAESQEPQRVALPKAREQRARLLALATGEGLPAALVHGLADADVTACDSLPDVTLTAYLCALADADLRERGKRPADETARALCRSCGPVWLTPEVASVAPMIDGWPRTLGCPWCHVVNRHALSRPEVACGNCRHFIRDTVNPAGGMGRCGIDREPLSYEPLHYPLAQRQCGQFNPEGTQ